MNSSGLIDEGRREKGTMGSGAEIWTFPSQHPMLRDEREFFYAFLDCTCVGGREVARGSAGTVYLIQCIPCWKRHFDHPETRKVHKEQLEALNAGTNEVDHYFQSPKGTP